MPILRKNVMIRPWRFARCLTATRGSLICSLVVVLLDVVLDGSYVFSLLVCPIWLFVSAALVMQRRPRLGVAAARVMIPIVTGLLVFMNYSVQRKIAIRNAAHLIQACERYHDANGAYPERLSDLVPRYLSSIPRAKYCCSYGEFRYYGPPRLMLFWYEIPPFGRRVYNFESGNWRYMD